MSKQTWERDDIQFARLLAELDQFGLNEDQYTALQESMDLERGDINELLERAQNAWDKIKEQQRKGEVGYKLLEKPLTLDEIAEMRKKNRDGYISGVVHVDLNDVIEKDLEGFLDTLSSKLTGTELLSDIKYTVVGVEDGDLAIKVEGDPEMVLEDR